MILPFSGRGGNRGSIGMPMFMGSKVDRPGAFAVYRAMHREATQN